MLPSKIVRGLYVVVLTIFTLSENSLGSPNDISPVRRNSGLDSEKKLETVLSEVKSEVNALKRKKDNKYGRKQGNSLKLITAIIYSFYLDNKLKEP